MVWFLCHQLQLMSPRMILPTCNTSTHRCFLLLRGWFVRTCVTIILLFSLRGQTPACRVTTNQSPPFCFRTQIADVRVLILGREHMHHLFSDSWLQRARAPPHENTMSRLLCSFRKTGSPYILKEKPECLLTPTLSMNFLVVNAILILPFHGVVFLCWADLITLSLKRFLNVLKCLVNIENTFGLYTHY